METGALEFEWDPAKEAANERKHGIAFEDATSVFRDPHVLIEDVTKPEYGEHRSKAIGRVDVFMITVIFTDRHGAKRIISARGPREMSESDIVRVRSLPDGTLLQVMPDGSTRPYDSPTKTEWARLEAMTEEEIEANALADPDNPPLTDEELARMRRVPNPKRIRETLKLTQEAFSERFEIPLGTLRDWEQGVSYPDSAARTLLRVIEQDPEGVVRALARSYEPPKPRAAR